jgi:hypothetical protein
MPIANSQGSLVAQATAATVQLTAKNAKSLVYMATFIFNLEMLLIGLSQAGHHSAFLGMIPDYPAGS